MSYVLHSENEVLSALLYMHVERLVERLRELPFDHYDFQFAPAAPSPRMLAEHAWAWLVCDRCHIEEPDARKHPPVQPPPRDKQQMCDLLLEEAETWRRLILGLSPEQMAAPRKQLNDRDMNVRAFVGHMVQNCVYKHGQFSTIYFALGLDGEGPYDAPIPARLYARMAEEGAN